jgi:hypothetical protein
MIHSEMIEKLSIIGDMANHKIGLLANLQGAKAIGTLQGRGGVERQGADYLGGQHFHLRAGHGTD